MPSQARTSARSRSCGYAIGLCAAAILATTGVIIRYLSVTYHLPALVMAFWRDLFVVVTLVPVLAVFHRGRLRAPLALLPYLAAYGFVLAVFNVLWTLSVTINGAAIATVMAYCSCAFAVFLGRWLLKEPLTPAKLLATALVQAQGAARVGQVLKGVADLLDGHLFARLLVLRRAHDAIRALADGLLK